MSTKAMNSSARGKIQSSFRAVIRRSTSNTSASGRTPRVCKLVLKRQWRALSDYLRTEEGHEEALKFGTTFTIDSTTRGDFVLHLTCRQHPPLFVVKDLIRACQPDAVSLLNIEKQTPLHVAAANGASARVVDFLIRMYPRAAKMFDHTGRSPLHLYAEHCCFPETCDTGNQEEELVKGPLIEVVQLLASAGGATAINTEDDDDMTPLEYAISFGADVKVVKSLQKASAKAWKKEKTQQEKRLSKNLTSSSSRRSGGSGSGAPGRVSSSVSSNGSSSSQAKDELAKDLEMAARAAVSSSRDHHRHGPDSFAAPGGGRVSVSRRKGGVGMANLQEALAASLDEIEKASVRGGGGGMSSSTMAAAMHAQKQASDRSVASAMSASNGGRGPPQKRRVSPARAA